MRTTLLQLERPKSVVIFEVVSVLYAATDMVRSRGESTFGNALELVTWLGLTLWVTRGRSPVARALYTGLLLVGTVGIAVFYKQGLIAANDVRFVVLQAIAVLVVLLTLLWWPSTTLWLCTPNRGSGR